LCCNLRGDAEVSPLATLKPRATGNSVGVVLPKEQLARPLNLHAHESVTGICRRRPSPPGCGTAPRRVARG
jgi:hypothetical protein